MILGWKSSPLVAWVNSGSSYDSLIDKWVIATPAVYPCYQWWATAGIEMLPAAWIPKWTTFVCLAKIKHILGSQKIQSFDYFSGKGHDTIFANFKGPSTNIHHSLGEQWPYRNNLKIWPSPLAKIHQGTLGEQWPHRNNLAKKKGKNNPPSERGRIALAFKAAAHSGRTTCLADKTNHPVKGLSLNRSQYGSCSTKYDPPAGT